MGLLLAYYGLLGLSPVNEVPGQGMSQLGQCWSDTDSDLVQGHQLLAPNHGTQPQWGLSSDRFVIYRKVVC